ncbi:chlorinating enzyme [Pseudomonas wayambapalatensis]|uniref:chlorinating enzyme n=1 Tax=Pseudomonas wayambapalatensis TaxID=485895 RepID=UPI003CE86651
MSSANNAIEATTGLPANAVITDDIKSDIEKFERDGFIGPIKLYEPEEAAEILRSLRANNQNRSHILYDNNMNYDRHFDIPELSSHIMHPTIIKYLKGILGPDLLCWRSEWFSKFPGGRATEWHQVRDYSYTDGNPLIVPSQSDWNAYIDLTVWTAFTPATIKTACMRFLPGSHKKFYYDEKKSVATGRNGEYKHDATNTGFFGYDFSEFKVDPDWDPESANPVEMELKPGECVIFTASCAHASHPNTTERETRLAITSRYVPTHVRVYPNLNSYNAHGETFDLQNYAAVLVSGEDTFGHNKLRDKNNREQAFAFNKSVKELA